MAMEEAWQLCGNCLTQLNGENHTEEAWGSDSSGNVAPMCDPCHENQE
jgi:hypothetical protein